MSGKLFTTTQIGAQIQTAIGTALTGQTYTDAKIDGSISNSVAVGLSQARFDAAAQVTVRVNFQTGCCSIPGCCSSSSLVLMY